MNSDGKVHGVKKTQNISDVSRKEAKGNCEICNAAETCKKRIEAINNPKNNPDYRSVEGYKDTIFIHNECDSKDLDMNLKTAKDLINAGFKDIKQIVINHHIFEDGLPNQEFTIVFNDGRKVYADRKGVTGEDAVTSSFRKAIKQCDRIVIIDTRHIVKIKPDEYARQLYGRLGDFQKGIIVEGIITRGGKVFRFDKDFMLSMEKNDLKDTVRNLLVPVKEIIPDPLPDLK